MIGCAVMSALVKTPVSALHSQLQTWVCLPCLLPNHVHDCMPTPCYDLNGTSCCSQQRSSIPLGRIYILRVFIREECLSRMCQWCRVAAQGLQRKRQFVCLVAEERSSRAVVASCVLSLAAPDAVSSSPKCFSTSQ